MTYDQFIQNILDTRGRFACGDEYHECHHIIPKCIGGTNDNENLIDLFAREHFIAHKLLAEEHGDNTMLLFAYTCMAFMRNDYEHRYELTPEEYEEAKIARSKSLTGKNNPNYGKHLSEECKKKISDANKGRESHNKGKHLSEDTKHKLKILNIGKNLSEETREKISNTLKGRPSPNLGKHPSEETREKMRKNHPDVTGKNNPMFGKTGEQHPMYGRTHTEESINKMREAHKRENLTEETRQKMRKNHADVSGGNNPQAKPVIRLCDLKIFDTGKEAAAEVGVSSGSITYKCKNKKDFMYYDEYLTLQNDLEK